MSVTLEQQGPERSGVPLSPIRPKDKILQDAAALGTPRPIEDCSWFHPVNVAFDMPPDVAYDPDHLQFAQVLAFSLLQQGHQVSGVPSDAADMTIGFHTLPDDRPLFERVEEIPAKATRAARANSLKGIMPKNYTTVVSVPDNFVAMKKRDAEEAARMIMTRIGSPSLILMTPEHLISTTMEGGAGYERRDDPNAIYGFRNRVVTRICAGEVGKPEGRHEVILQSEWDASPYPHFLTNAFRKFGEWGYIDQPFDVRRVALSAGRVEEVDRAMQWTRQSESAGGVADPTLTVPDEFRMAANGVIIATRTGRDESAGPVDKRYLEVRHTLPVALLQKDGKYVPYSLGIGDNITVGRPSVEVDEMMAAFLTSPLVRVSRHPSDLGWMPDPNGPVTMNMLRGFIHGHFNIEEITTQLMMGVPAVHLWEHVDYNFVGFPYAVGCGSKTQFDATTDAVARSRAVQDPSSSFLVVSFDQQDHGAAIGVLAKPLPGTNLIPDDPFALMLDMVNPQNGFVRLTDQIAQV